ncbi:hypothetical protein [Streptomyces vinaceus]|uniref:hypothetical protein n=1 Tax=Streptomyces vinaceus TaxID=1960 RepID=UPI0036B5FC44
MRHVTAAAAKDAAVGESLGVAHASLRAGLAATAARLDEPGAIRPGLTVPEATDVFWYFLGNGFYFTLADDCRWPLERPASFLIDRGAG